MNQVVADGRLKHTETTEIKAGVDVNRKKQGRGRGHSASGRGRGSKSTEQIRSPMSMSTVSQPNGQFENSYQKVCIY